MRHASFATVLFLAAIMTGSLAPQPGRAQGQQEQLPLPPGGFRPPPMAPAKPYHALAVTPPGHFDDPGFLAFRKQLADAAQRKDRAALTKLVVPQGFFWIQDKDLADKRKSGIANLAMALDLDGKNTPGWDALVGYANDPTGAPLPDRAGVICAPADPSIDPKAFEALLEATQTEPLDWGYPMTDGVIMRSTAKPDAPVVEKLGLVLVRVLPDSAPPEDPNQPALLHVAAPSGKTGFVPAEAFSGLGGDQMCYIKDASGWKITGYFGGAAQ